MWVFRHALQGFSMATGCLILINWAELKTTDWASVLNIISIERISRGHVFFKFKIEKKSNVWLKIIGRGSKNRSCQN